MLNYREVLYNVIQRVLVNPDFFDSAFKHELSEDQIREGSATNKMVMQVSAITPEVRKKRRDLVAAEALESVAKSEQFNFRMDADTIRRLYQIAGAQKKPVGALVREWVLEKIEEEQKAPSTRELMQEIIALRDKTISCFEALSKEVTALGLDSTYSVPQPPSMRHIDHETNKE